VIALLWWIYFGTLANTGPSGAGRWPAPPPPNWAGVNNGMNQPPTPAVGALAFNNGVAKVDAQLTVTDSRDRFLQGSACKVYTIQFVAGKVYQIDMVRARPDIDPYL